MGNLRSKLRERLTYANVVSTMCLFLLLGGTAAAVDGSLPGQNSVGSADIINGEVAFNDLAANSVGTEKIIDGRVKNPDLGPGAADTNTIRDDGVRSIDVRDDSLPDGGLIGVDIANESLTGAEITNESLTGADVQDRTLNRADYTSISGATHTQLVSAPVDGVSACMPISVPAPGVNVGDIGLVTIRSGAPNGAIVSNQVQTTAGQLAWDVCATTGSFSFWTITFSLTALR